MDTTTSLLGTKLPVDVFRGVGTWLSATGDIAACLPGTQLLVNRGQSYLYQRTKLPVVVYRGHSFQATRNRASCIPGI